MAKDIAAACDDRHDPKMAIGNPHMQCNACEHDPAEQDDTLG